MNPGRKKDRYVYILHIAYLDGSHTHYVGSTTQRNIRRRLEQQRWSNGAIITREAMQQGANIQLGAILPNSNYEFEHAMASSYLGKHMCMVCTPREPSFHEQREAWPEGRASKAARKRAAASKSRPDQPPSSPRPSGRRAPRASGRDGD
jgi:hypothetical protein